MRRILVSADLGGRRRRQQQQCKDIQGVDGNNKKWSPREYHIGIQSDCHLSIYNPVSYFRFVQSPQSGTVFSGRAVSLSFPVSKCRTFRRYRYPHIYALVAWRLWRSRLSRRELLMQDVKRRRSARTIVLIF